MKHFFPVGFESGRGPSQMETFANIIVKGLNRRNNLFLDVALYPKLGALYAFLRRSLCFPVWLRRLYLSPSEKGDRLWNEGLAIEPSARGRRFFSRIMESVVTSFRCMVVC